MNTQKSSKITDAVLLHNYAIDIKGFEQLNLIESYNLTLEKFECSFVLTESTIKDIFSLSKIEKLEITVTYVDKDLKPLHSEKFTAVPSRLEVAGDIIGKGLRDSSFTRVYFACDILRD
jgi:hypothetical protein